MRDAVRRRIDTLRFQVTNGSEGTLLQVDPLVTDQDINLFLNTALIKRSVDVNVADNTIMADSAYADIKAGVTEYPLPEDLMFLRAVYWRPDGLPNNTPTLEPPVQRIFIYESDQDSDIAVPLFVGSVAPSYRRRLNLIVLNQVPQIDNILGLEFDYVKTFLPLAVDDQVIETPLATIIQEVVILDAAIECVVQKMKMDASGIQALLAPMEARLNLAVVNYHAPKTIRMVPQVTYVMPPYARRNFGWQNSTWWGGGRSWS
jgi:hypothetical protein